MKNHYTIPKTIETWVDIIETKFNLIPLGNEDEMLSVLGIDSQDEISKIRKAFLIAYGKRIGILSYEDACFKLGIEPNPPVDNKFTVAAHKLNIIIKAINGGLEPNWTIISEPRYAPFFDLSSPDKIIEFESVVKHWHFRGSTSSSTFYFMNSESAYFVGNYFIDLYQDFMVN